MNKIKAAVTLALLAVLSVLIILTVTNLAIWALNTLFALGLAHSLTNNAAVFVLAWLINSYVPRNSQG